MSNLIIRMQNEGLEPGYPKRGLIDAASIDGEVCAESSCSECGHAGMLYKPFVGKNTYRAFAVCEECGNEEEF
jgi:hypothetical protein